MSAVASLVIGIVFGLALQKAGLGRYDTIVNQFRFKDFTMLKFMLSAIAVGAIGTFLLRSAGLLDASTTPEGYLAAAGLGGAILGAGMAIAGTCPGTIYAGIGQGNLDYIVPGVLGMVAGSFIYGITFDSFAFNLWDAIDIGQLDFAQLLGVNPWVLVVTIVVGVVAFYVANRAWRRRKG